MFTYISKADKFRDDISCIKEPYKEFLKIQLAWSKKRLLDISTLTPAYQMIASNELDSILTKFYRIDFKNIIIYEE